MTWTDLLSDIRTALNDPSKEHWGDTDLLQRVIATRQELYGPHPEAFYVSSVVTAIPSDPTEAQLTATIDFLPTWAEAVRAHVLWQCYMEDSDERQNVKLAEDYFAIWSRKVG